MRHIDRETDRLNNCEVSHSNPNIRSELTLLNESYFKDTGGNWRGTDKPQDMLDAINRRIDYAREHGARIACKGQNDTVIVRPLVVQLDEENISKHPKTWMWDVISETEKMFGKDNIVGFSLHRDETNEHLHIAFIPCVEKQTDNGTVKCAISQTHYFRNPKSLAGMHRRLRKALVSKGYDIDMENKPIEEHLAGYTDKDGNWHQQGLTPEQLKELENRQLELKIGEIQMNIRKSELDKLEATMRDVQSKAKETQEKLDAEREKLELQQSILATDRQNVQEQLNALLEEKENVNKMKKDAENMMEQASATAAVCGQILDDEKHLNAKFLEFLDKEGAKRNKDFRGFVERLYKMFMKQRKDSMSPWALELMREHQKQRIQREQGQFPTNTSAYDNSPFIIDNNNGDMDLMF